MFSRWTNQALLHLHTHGWTMVATMLFVLCNSASPSYLLSGVFVCVDGVFEYAAWHEYDQWLGHGLCKIHKSLASTTIPVHPGFEE